MSLALLKNLSDSCTLALWKIEESVESLKQLSGLDSISMKTVENFHIDKRKKEWLCVRILIKEIFGRNIEIEYMENGKPFICNEPFSISISHSKDFAGVIVSRQGEVGLDIEYISPRIEKIKEKFLSIDELNQIHAGENYQKQLLLYWCAKESIVKITGEKHLDFKKQIKILPFKYIKTGSFTCEETITGNVLSYCMNYFEFDNYIIVWSYSNN